MHASIDELTSRVQRIAANLRPLLLDNVGLPAAIEWHVTEFSKRTGLECFMMLNDDIAVNDRNTATAIMRVVQEGLTNVARHARATEINISLCRNGGELLLEISDNGCGITPEQVASQKAYGMMSMQERARMCLPEMGGLELAQKLLELCPRLKHLFMSGYPAGIIASRGLINEGLHFIHKPFSLLNFAVKVREVLDDAEMVL